MKIYSFFQKFSENTEGKALNLYIDFGLTTHPGPDGRQTSKRRKSPFPPYFLLKNTRGRRFSPFLMGLGLGRGPFLIAGRGSWLAREARFCKFCILANLPAPSVTSAEVCFRIFCDFITFAVYFSAFLRKNGHFLIIFDQNLVKFPGSGQKLHVVERGSRSWIKLRLPWQSLFYFSQGSEIYFRPV